MERAAQEIVGGAPTTLRGYGIEEGERSIGPTKVGIGVPSILITALWNDLNVMIKFIETALDSTLIVHSLPSSPSKPANIPNTFCPS